MWCHYVCSGHWHNYFMQPGKAIRDTANCIFDDYDYTLPLMTMHVYWFCFVTACGAIMFAVASDTTIACSLWKQYRPDDYGCSLSFMFLFWFSFGTACGIIMFAMATDTTISCSLGKQYMPAALFVSLMIMVTVFFNDYVFVLILLWYSMWRHYICSGHWHNYFMQPGKGVWASAHCILDDYDCNLSLMTMFLFWFSFGTAFGAIIFAVTTDTAITCSLGKQYEQCSAYLSLISMDKTVFYTENNITAFSRNWCCQLTFYLQMTNSLFCNQWYF